jgi:hypothetical protein
LGSGDFLEADRAQDARNGVAGGRIYIPALHALQ